MITLQICSTHFLTTKRNSTFAGIASDGFFLYCTAPDSTEIHRFEPGFSKRRVYPVCRPYTSICYDTHKACFWALATDSNACIYQLDFDLRETDSISLSFPGRNPVCLNGIACNQAATEFLVTAPGFYAHICRRTYQVTCLRQINIPHTRYLCTEIPGNDYLFAVCKNKRSEIILTSRSEEILLHCQIDCRYTPVDFAISYSLSEPNCCLLYLLASDSCGCYHVLQYRLSGCCCEPGPDREQSCNDLIESIALVEAALAHILNTEGEKLQKVIGCSDNICEIIKVNQSVTDMVRHVTELEGLLVEKLRIVQSI